MNIKSLLIGLCIVYSFGLIAVNQVSYADNASQVKEKQIKENQSKEKTMSDKHIVIVELEAGTVTIELYPDVAPETVANFEKLIKKGFYDGLTFHRVIPGFMAQGGDPDGTGMGGPGYSVKAEFSDKKHVRGTLAMARSSDPDSAGSQFYICYGPQPHLDGQYTIFGQVTDGMELVDDLKNGSIIKEMTLVSGE